MEYSFFALLVTVLGIPLLISIAVISVVYIIQWKRVRQAQIEADLKKEMIERGMSADEIVKVLQASPSTSGEFPPTRGKTP